MSFTRTRYDSCDKNNRCNMPTGTGEYIMDLNRFENNSSCNINSGNNLNFYFSDIEKKINIENELKSLNQQLGKCGSNKPTLCSENSNQDVCNVKPAVKNICDRSILCGNLTNPNQTNCFGLNAGLNCK